MRVLQLLETPIRGIIAKNTLFIRNPLFLPIFPGFEISLKRPKMRVLSIFSSPQGEVLGDLAFA